MKKVRIGVFGHYGNNNLGDESIIHAVLQNLKLRLPEAEFVGFSLNPDNSKKRFGIECFPIRDSTKNRETVKSTLKRRIDDNIAFKMINRPVREIGYLKSVFHQLKELDLLLVCGSNQFLDSFGGVRGYPYTIMKWAVMARFRGVKVAYASVGAGPILNTVTYRVLNQALIHADYLSYRDQGSKELVESHISGLNGLIYPDLAHGLTTQPVVTENKNNQIIVGINPMPVFDSRYWYKSDEQKYKNYLSELTKFTQYLMDSGHKVQFFNTHPKDILVIDDIKSQLREKGDNNKNFPEVVNLTLVDGLVNAIAAMDVVVATRFHATVLPIRLGIPVIGICYYRKSKELLVDMGLGEFQVDIHDFSFEDLRDRMNLMLNNIEELKSLIQTNFQEYRVNLDEQWDKIADLVKK